MRKLPNHIFVDESIHSHLGFILTAFVCVIGDPQQRLSNILSELRFSPGKDEYKSRTLMSNNPRMRELRERLFEMARNHSYVAILITPALEREALGHYIISALRTIIIRNGLDVSILKLYFDQGIFRSAQKGLDCANKLAELSGIEFFFEQDSKKVLGLQIADAISHATSQVLREALTGTSKQVDIGGENTGYPEGTLSDLGWSLLMTLRYSFFVRPVVLAQYDSDINPSMEAVIVSDEEELIQKSQNPDLFGWGVLVSDEVTPEIKKIVEGVFGTLWLGCIH